MENKTKKNGKISVGDLEKAAMDGYIRSRTVSWHGLEIEVKYTLGLDEMLVFVRNVVRACFDKEQTAYHPELKDFAVRSVLLELYTNLSLPSGLGRLYDIVYCSDLTDAVFDAIDQRQFETMMRAVDEQTNYILQSNAEAVTRQINALSETIEGLGEKFKGMFDGVEPEDIQRTLAAIGENGLDEAKLMQAYLDRGKEARDEA